MKKLIYLIKALLYSFILIAALFLVVRVVDASELSPEWYQRSVSPNSYLLSNTIPPSFLPPNLSTQILGQKNILMLQQDYLNENRDYNLKQLYGLNTTVDEATYESNMRGFGHQVIGAARNNQVSQYGGNIRTSEDNGSISQPLVYTGAIGAFGMGTPVKTEMLGNKIEWNGDLMRQHGMLNIDNPILTTQFEIDQSDNPEHYKATVNKTLPFNLNSSVVYGSTSGSVSAVLSRSLGWHLAASVDTIRPVGTTTNVVTGESVGLSYGIGF